MEILELNLKHFGKFLEHRMKLHPGMNIIYGGNETGKSTIHAFIRSMFFGIEAGRGRKGEEYLLRQPWDNPAYFAGTLRLNYKGKIFRIERNFNKNEKEVHLICEDSGQELSAEQEELSALLAGLNETAFVNTVFIPQAGSETDAGLAEELQKFMINFQETRDGDLDVRKALERLKAQKRALGGKRRQEQELLDEKIARKQMELDYVRQEMEKLTGKKAEEDQNPGRESGKPESLESAWTDAEKGTGKQMELDLWPGLGREEKREKTGSGENWGEGLEADWEKTEAEEEFRSGQFYRRFLLLLNVLLFAGGILGAACGALAQGWSGKLALFGLGALFLTLFWLTLRYTIQGKHRGERNGESREKDWASNRDAHRKFGRGRTWEDDFGTDPDQEGDSENQASDSRDMASDSRERRLLERGKLLWKREEHQNQVQERNVRLEILQKELEELFAQREGLYSYQREMEAVELAAQRIRELSERIYREAGADFSDRASAILEELTEGRYTHIALDEKMQVKINTPSKLLELRQVSYGTMNQIYFALRMAAGEVLTAGQPLPVILDEPFAMYDEERLEAALRWLNRSGRQVILFTCQTREKYILERIRRETTC